MAERTEFVGSGHRRRQTEQHLGIENNPVRQEQVADDAHFQVLRRVKNNRVGVASEPVPAVVGIITR